MATAAEAPCGEIEIGDLIAAGLHFGHQTKRWNPKMRRFIFGKRNGIHIIDLSQSLVLLNKALEFIQSVASSGKSVLFVGTKKQAQQVIKETALACGQPYVTTRWLGGTLTNLATIRQSVKRMRELEEKEKSGAFATMHKKEASMLRHELEKLRRNLTGIADMYELPGAIFVVDVQRENIAVAEARRLGVPVVAIVDTNCDPEPIDYVIPGNDDAIRAIKLIAEKIAEAVKQGAEQYAKMAAELARQREANAANETAAQTAASQSAAATETPSGGDELPGRKREAEVPRQPGATKSEGGRNRRATRKETPKDAPVADAAAGQG